MNPNLLIVDDEQHTREGLELALEDNFEVFLASKNEQINGTKAIINGLVFFLSGFNLCCIVKKYI